MMPIQPRPLQAPFLNVLRREHVPVSIYLIGQIESFDPHVVLLKNAVTRMAYKHAISTVVPARRVELAQADEDVRTATADSLPKDGEPPFV